MASYGHHDGSDLSPGGAEPRQRAGFREERDRLVLANAFFSIAFSTLASGAIVSIYNRQSHTEFVSSDEAGAEGFLWRVTVAARDGSTATVTNRTCDEFAHTVAHEPDGSLHLRLTWTGLRIGAGPVVGEVVADWIFPAHGSTALAGLAIRLPDHLSVRSIEFPCLCSLGASDPRTEEGLFLPISSGMLVPEPRGLLVPGEAQHWEVAYPGEASIQLLGYSCGPNATLGLACHDPAGAEKRLVAEGMPRSNRLVLYAAVQPAPPHEGVWGPGFPLAVSVVTGDWLEAAREYRAWAIEQPWCARGRGGLRNLPPLTLAPGLWVSFWGGPRAVATVMRDLQRLVATPLKLDWRCWHGCARDGAYPDYLPPREGDEVFVQATIQLAEAGMLTQLGFNGVMASPQSESWRSQDAGRYAIHPEAAPAAEGDGAPLVAMCPLTSYWRRTLANTARAAMALGATGVYLEDVVGPRSLVCRQTDHGHEATGREQWVKGVRAALHSVRETLPPGEVHLAVDGPSECYLDLADLMFTAHSAAERVGSLGPRPGWRPFGPSHVSAGAREAAPGGERLGGPAELGSAAPASGRFEPASLLRWTPIPLFAAVYHSYATLVSYGISLANNQPYDPQWTAETIAALHEPEDLMQRDFSGQFYLEAARSIVGGEQLMITSPTQRQIRDGAARRRLAFLRAALQAQAWGAGKLLPFSEFMGLLDVNAIAVDVEMLVNPPGCSPEDRHTVRRRQTPVLGSAWRTPGEGTAILLVNIHDQPAEFSAALRPSRLGISAAPGRALDLAGRTFTPDSEAPAATLHASASEISGRLPPRAIFLVSMR